MENSKNIYIYKGLDENEAGSLSEGSDNDKSGALFMTPCETALREVYIYNIRWEQGREMDIVKQK